MKLGPGLQCLRDSHHPLIATVHHLSTWQEPLYLNIHKIGRFLVEGAPPEDRFVAFIRCDDPALPCLHTLAHPLLPNAA